MSKVNGIVNPQIQPWLFEQGLAEPCTHCKGVREVVRQLERLPAGVLIYSGKAYLPEQEDPLKPEVMVWQLRVHCDHCNNSGVTPTKRGALVLAFVQTFAQHVSPAKLDECEEIPF